MFAFLLLQRKHSEVSNYELRVAWYKSGCAFSSEDFQTVFMILFPGSNSRCSRCDLPCKFCWPLSLETCDLKKMYPVCLHITLLCTFLCFCLSYEHTGCLLKFVDNLHCMSFMLISIYWNWKSKSNSDRSLHTHNLWQFFIFSFCYKHHCVPCKHVLFSVDSDKLWGMMRLCWTIICLHMVCI